LSVLSACLLLLGICVSIAEFCCLIQSAVWSCVKVENRILLHCSEIVSLFTRLAVTYFWMLCNTLCRSFCNCYWDVVSCISAVDFVTLLIGFKLLNNEEMDWRLCDEYFSLKYKIIIFVDYWALINETVLLLLESALFT